MFILENPIVIVGLLIMCFIVLGIFGIRFAVKGINAAKKNDVPEFLTVNKIKNLFERLSKSGSCRSIIYIGISFEDVRRLYSEARVEYIFSEIKLILLNYFAAEEGCGIALYNRTDFMAVNNRGIKTTENNIECCVGEINKCLLKFHALNVFNVKFGSYSAVASGVSFSEALNRAKQAYIKAEDEKIPFAEWNGSDDRALKKKIKMENTIETEIDNNKFLLEYQPTIDAKSGKIIGAEVLSRLNSVNDGIITPKNFLSALDSVGLCSKFDYYIFEKNCKWIANNKQQREKYRYTVNFSRTTLTEPVFADKVTEIVKKYNINCGSLAIEILEDKEVTGEAKNKIKDNLEKLKKQGIAIFLDDFGNGYTSFDDLQTFPVDTVKIDRIITGNTNTETGLVIFNNIVRMAKDLGLAVICEGIETEKQKKTAIDAGCDMLQGFYYYRPMPVAELEKLFGEDTEK